MNLTSNYWLPKVDSFCRSRPFFCPFCYLTSPFLLRFIFLKSFFFMKKKKFSVFLLISTTKITHKKKFFHMYISKTHLHKIHFLLEIFRLFFGLWHPKLKKHKKWNISSGFEWNLLIFGVVVVFGLTNKCAKFQFFKKYFDTVMKFWNIHKMQCKRFYLPKFFFQIKNFANCYFLT